MECLQALCCVNNEMLEVRYCQINSCANTAKLKWNVSEYSTTVTAAALEQAVQVRRPGVRYTKNVNSHIPQDLDRKPRALIMHAH